MKMKYRFLVFVVGFTLALAGCGSGGGSNTQDNPPGGITTITGRVVDGAIAGGIVSVYKINTNGTKGTQVGGPATTGTDGRYSVTASYEGPVVIECSGGSYKDWATGTTINLTSSNVLSAVIPNATGAVTAQITPLTYMAAKKALKDMATNGTNVSAAISTANSGIGSYFGNTDILSTSIIDPTVSNSAAGAGQTSINYTLILAGLSQYAETNGISNPFELVTALANDASDGTFDGKEGATQLSVGGTSLSPSTATSGLSTAITSFQSSTENTSGATITSTITQDLNTSTGAITPPSGSLDLTFGTGGKVTTSVGSDDSAYAVDFQSDGKVVVAGHSYNGSTYLFAVARYNSNGSLDTSFDTDGKVTTSFGTGRSDWGKAVGIQSDGKIVVAGVTGDSNGMNGDIALARYNSNGTLDSAFGTNGKVTTDIGGYFDEVRDLVLQSDGKIVVAGFSAINSGFAVVRYNTNGSLDSTFGTGGVVTTSFGNGTAVGFSLGIQADGKIVVSGGFSDGANYGFAAARYSTTGSLDTTFGTGGKVTTVISTPTGTDIDYTTDLKIQSDGKIVVAGHSATGVSYAGTDFVLVRYNTDGSLDSTFGTGGKVITDIGTSNEKAVALAVQSNGKIIAAGLSNGPTSFISTLVRYNTDGSLDTTFDTDGKLTTSIGSSFDGFMDVGIQADGTIVAVGAASNNGSTAVFSLARYWP